MNAKVRKAVEALQIHIHHNAPSAWCSMIPEFKKYPAQYARRKQRLIAKVRKLNGGRMPRGYGYLASRRWR